MALAGLRKLKRRRLTPEDFGKFSTRILREKNDRVVAISLCVFLDKCLQARILPAFSNETVAWTLFDDRGLLESFGSKILMGHALGLYGNQTRRNLDIIRQVRN